jgi:AsmA-like C-terminal region
MKSNFLDVDQLFEIGFGESKSEGYQFSISPNVHLNFNCDVKSLKYKRFHPKNIKGDLLVKNQVAVSRNIAMKAMGGDLSLNGIVDAKNPKAIDVVSSFKLNGIHVDSVFYVFENFFQTFIQDKHLKGQAFADVNLEMTLTEDLKLISKTLIADISATIKNGELNNFAPLQALNKYLDDETLNKLRFADLKNDIHIENETIYIPQMEIKSNATTIQLSGTHTFDQRIDYRVAAPLRSKKKIDPDEAFGAIEEDTKGQTKLFLKITGTTDKYSIVYDKEAVKKKIVSDLKKEVKELKEAFQLKGKKKKKELELEKDEYFDWEN